MTRPKNENEDLILSISKKYEKLIEQTHRNQGDIGIQTHQVKRNISFQPTNSN